MQDLPCPRHGSPGMLSPKAAGWIDFFKVVAPYTRDGALDHVLISKLCKAEQIDFCEALEWLMWINEQIQENARDGDGKGDGSRPA